MHQIPIYSHLFGAVVFLMTAVALCFHRSTRQQIPLIIAAATITSIWCLSAVLYLKSWFPFYSWVALTEVIQDGAWCFSIIGLIELTQKTQQQASRWFTHRYFKLFLLVLLSLLAVNAFHLQTQWRSDGGNLFAQFNFIGNITFSVIALALIEQLYLGTNEEKRWSIKFIAIGIGLMFCYDLYLFANALLLKHINPPLWEMRGGVCALMAPIILWGVFRNPTWQYALMPSRKLIYGSSAFVSCGFYLVIMSIAGYGIREFGGNWGRALQILFLSGSIAVLMLLLLSGSVRARFTQFFVRNIFKLRYDYRQEWLNLSNVLSNINQDNLYQLTIKTIANLVESPKGVLFQKMNEHEYQLIETWNTAYPKDESQINISIKDTPLTTAVGPILHEVELQQYSVFPVGTPWLWIPLKFISETVYFVALAQPRASIQINWEVRDILMMVGRQLAVTLVQSQHAKALAVAKQFEAFNQVSAFIAHDLKNIASQLILISQNKDKHRDNPKFIQSVFQTIDSLNIKLDKLLKQFTRQEYVKIDKIKLNKALQDAVSQRIHRFPQPNFSWKLDVKEVEIPGNPYQFVNVICHLIENAQQATPPNGKVELLVSETEHHLEICIRDTGKGMTPEFMRTQLFKPFVSSKGKKGMGIGVYQAKTVIETQGGQIQVRSQEGQGTEFRLLYPMNCVVHQNNIHYREPVGIKSQDEVGELTD